MQARLGRALAVLAAGTGAALVVVAFLLPASVAGTLLRTASGGRLELVQAQGTIWSGQGVLMVSPGRTPGGVIDTATPGAPGALLPGQFSWSIAASRLLQGTLDATVSDPGVLDAPVRIRADLSRTLSVDPGRMRLAATALTALGAPWNTIRPGGTLLLEWDALQVRREGARGATRLHWIDASSGLNPVAPFGHYVLQADGWYEGARIDLTTVAGPMEMVGNGTIAGGRVRFSGTARVAPGTDAAVAQQLAGLLSLLGPREGELTLLRFGS
jgi:general secretion pathway protein N